MYKTVRKGETSLQYHILPQDDVSPGHVMKRRRSSRHRTAFILVLTLILGCAIVAAAVLIPVLMTSTTVPQPARFQTFAVAASSVNVRPHGKYTLQGTQYIALLPVRDSLGHFNAYQLKPSLFTTSTTTTTTTTTTSAPTTTTSTTSSTTTVAVPRSVRTENNDPHRPPTSRPSKEATAGTTCGPWCFLYDVHSWSKSGTFPMLVYWVVVVVVALLTGCCLGLCLRSSRSMMTLRREPGLDTGSASLLADVMAQD